MTKVFRGVVAITIFATVAVVYFYLSSPGGFPDFLGASKASCKDAVPKVHEIVSDDLAQRLQTLGFGKDQASQMARSFTDIGEIATESVSGNSAVCSASARFDWKFAGMLKPEGADYIGHLIPNRRITYQLEHLDDGGWWVEVDPYLSRDIK